MQFIVKKLESIYKHLSSIFLITLIPSGMDFTNLKRLIEVVLYCHLQYHNDTIIKTQEDFFRKIFVPLTLFVRVRKGCVGFYCERELETEQKLQYFDLYSYGRLRYIFLVLLMLNRRPRGPEAHSAGCWLSLLHLINNFSGPQLNRGPRAPSAWCGFHYHISSITPSELQL